MTIPTRDNILLPAYFHCLYFYICLLSRPTLSFCYKPQKLNLEFYKLGLISYFKIDSTFTGHFWNLLSSQIFMIVANVRNYI